MVLEPRNPGTRIPTPTALGVKLPPSRQMPAVRLPSPSVAPESAESELVLQWLKLVHGELVQTRATSDERFEQLARSDEDQERRINLLEKGILKIDTVDARLENMSERLFRGLEHDVLTSQQVANLRVEMARSASASGAASGTESGNAAGAKAGKKWGWVAVAVSFVIAVLRELWSHLSAAANQ